MAYHNINHYVPRPRRRLSTGQHILPTVHLSGRAASGMSSSYNSPSNQPPMNSNGFFIDTTGNAYYQNTAMPQAISPHPEIDVLYMQESPPYMETPSRNSILASPLQFHPSAHPYIRNPGYSPPWNVSYTIREEMSGVGFNSTMNDTFLNVPQDTRNRGTRRTGGSFSTVDTPYTKSSAGVSDASHEQPVPQRPRGGRRRGTQLSPRRLQNVRQVRDIGGACFRCIVSKEGCSPGTPCENCSQVKGRLWSGCLRSFRPLATLLIPDILARRLGSEALHEWITTNTFLPEERIEFDLPLNLGFGPPFIGFRGTEYIPRTDEAQWTSTVGGEDEPRFNESLNVIPINSHSHEVQKLVLKWLIRILKSDEGMEEWLKTCFPGSRTAWIRHLLGVVREHSDVCLDDTLPHEDDPHQIDRSLLDAWVACFLVTMLSLPITIPTHEDIVSQYIRNSIYSYPSPNTSRALTKCVKSLLVDIYQGCLKRIAAALDRFDQLGVQETTERHTTNVFCISVLVMVLTSQIQTSLVDNSRISSRYDVDPARRDRTLGHLKNVEDVFKNTVLYTRHKRKEWVESVVVGDLEGSRLLSLHQRMVDIAQRNRAEIQRHGRKRMEDLDISRGLFHQPNMLRVFAFFSKLLEKEDLPRRGE